jgi:GT2 family glycosyltransferase
VVDRLEAFGASPSDVHDGLTAQALARAGWRVYVLECDRGRADRSARPQRDNSGITFFHIDQFPMPSYWRPTAASFLRRSDRVRRALEALQAAHRFDLIHLSERGALGFRTLQARLTGLSFGGVGIIVRLAGSSQWQRENELRWMANIDDLQLDFCEGYSFEHADWQISHSHALLAYARESGWVVRDDALVVEPALSAGSRVREDGLTTFPDPGQAASTLPFYAQCLAKARLSQATSPAGASGKGGGGGPAATAMPLVTVGVSYYNLPRYLPAALASLARQTYPHLEVLVVNDGSTDPEAVRVFEQERLRYPQLRFLSQDNRGLSEARNRALAEARGDFFLPVDADNVARPHMVEWLVRAMLLRPELAAMSCFHLAFRTAADLAAGRFCYESSPTGGPYVMGCLANVFGDANAIFRTHALRAVGGYEVDRDSTCEDWEVFVKLCNAGYSLDVLPEHLFYYRHREDSLLRTTHPHRNHWRVLRQYFWGASLTEAEQAALWTALVSLHQRQSLLRYRLADRLCALAGRWPLVHGALRWLLRCQWRPARALARLCRVRWAAPAPAAAAPEPPPLPKPAADPATGGPVDEPAAGGPGHQDMPFRWAG